MVLSRDDWKKKIRGIIMRTFEEILENKPRTILQLAEDLDELYMSAWRTGKEFAMIEEAARKGLEPDPGIVVIKMRDIVKFLPRDTAAHPNPAQIATFLQERGVKITHDLSKDLEG